MKILPALPRPGLAILAVLFSAASLRAQPPPPPGVKAIHDVDYVGDGNKRQMLDLYVPRRRRGSRVRSSSSSTAAAGKMAARRAAASSSIS
jgi:hypothetical protein